MIRQVHLNISGFVQGVLFRASAQHAAQKLQLSGCVRNLPDGSVEIIAEGEEAFLNRLIGWCQQGPPGAKVDNVSISWKEPEKHFSGFNIR